MANGWGKLSALEGSHFGRCGGSAPTRKTGRSEGGHAWAGGRRTPPARQGQNSPPKVSPPPQKEVGGWGRTASPACRGTDSVTPGTHKPNIGPAGNRFCTGYFRARGQGGDIPKKPQPAGKFQDGIFPIFRRCPRRSRAIDLGSEPPISDEFAGKQKNFQKPPPATARAGGPGRGLSVPLGAAD